MRFSTVGFKLPALNIDYLYRKHGTYIIIARPYKLDAGFNVMSDIAAEGNATVSFDVMAKRERISMMFSSLSQIIASRFYTDVFDSAYDDVVDDKYVYLKVFAAAVP